MLIFKSGFLWSLEAKYAPTPNPNKVSVWSFLITLIAYKSFDFLYSASNILPYAPLPIVVNISNDDISTFVFKYWVLFSLNIVSRFTNGIVSLFIPYIYSWISAFPIVGFLKILYYFFIFFSCNIIFLLFERKMINLI